MLTTDSILNDVLSQIRDNSTPMRTKLLGWQNRLLQELYLERDWKFLEKETTATVADNRISFPEDYGRFRFVSGDGFFLSPRHRLTEEEAFTYTDGESPLGFTEGTHFVFHPGAQGEVRLGYVRTLPEYGDGETTILPAKFKPLLVRSLLTLYYEYDVDERGMPSLQLDSVELAKLKAEENRQKAIPQRSPKGLIR